MRRFSSLGHRLRGAALLRRETFDEAVGNTPLIKLQGPSAATGCDIYGKCEFMNPAGSVKDRAALNIFREAEAAGKLGRGGVIVEGTAGNTGIGLAAVAATRGVKCVVVIPETQTEEKKDFLRQLGARVVEVPAAPYKSENNYQKVSKRLADALGGVWANQFDNTANRDAHVRTTGPEIWRQTEGRVDAFSCAVGTGGTLAGTAEHLRSVLARAHVADHRALQHLLGLFELPLLDEQHRERHERALVRRIGAQGRVEARLRRHILLRPRVRALQKLCHARKRAPRHALEAATRARRARHEGGRRYLRKLLPQKAVTYQS